MTKLTQSLTLIREHTANARNPAVMLSFGKDSMVLADLIRTAVAPGERFPRAHAFPVPVIYHRDPWFPAKQEFAERIIRSWGMEVHDFPPAACGVKVNDDAIELVSRYNFGTSALDIPKNVLGPTDAPRRDYICGLNDWLLRPKSAVFPYPWDVVFIGHKSADVDPFEGRVPLNTDCAEIGGVRLVFPLRHWSDGDVWNHIEKEHLSVQGTRYTARTELADKWYNNDYTHACTACIDPRNKASEVFCPKLKRDVPNRGAQVLQLRATPDYIEKERAA